MRRNRQVYLKELSDLDLLSASCVLLHGKTPFNIITAFFSDI